MMCKVAMEAEDGKSVLSFLKKGNVNQTEEIITQV